MVVDAIAESIANSLQNQPQLRHLFLVAPLLLPSTHSSLLRRHLLNQDLAKYQGSLLGDQENRRNVFK